MSAEVITCSKVIALHALDSPQPVSKYTHHRGIVNCVNINHTNKVIATCGQDGKVVLVTADKPDTKLLEHQFYPNAKEKPSALSSCAFSPNSKHLAVGSVDSVVKVWDLRGQSNPQKQQAVAQIKSHMCGVTSLAWVRNLRADLYGSDILASSSSSGDIFLHSNKSGSFQEVMGLKLQEGINCVRVSEGADYCRMAACTNGGTLAVWDLMGGKQKPVWSFARQFNKASMTSLSISSFSPVLLVTASVDQSLTFFDIHVKRQVKKISVEQPLNCVGLHSDGRTLVAGGMYGNCFVYDMRNPSKPQNKLGGHETTVKQLQFFKTKQKELSQAMGQNKSKAPSVVNSNNTSHISSQPMVEHKSQNITHFQQQQAKSKENIKVPQIKTNNFITANSQKTISEEAPRERKIQTKLSSTAQEIVKTHSIRSEIMPLTSDIASQGFRNRSKEPIRYQTRPQIPNSRREGEAKELSDKVSQLHGQLKQLKGDMFGMEERLNMTIVRQFQLQQVEMKGLLQSLVSRQRQREQYVKRLQAQNGRLRNSTF